MSQKLFTEEEVLALRSSPYVESVSRRSVLFTPAFKQTCYEALQRGEPLKKVLEAHGIDTGALGAVRVNGLREKLEKQAERPEGFENLRKQRRQKQPESAETKLERRVRQLEHQLAYAQQEVEFLKKLQQANTEAQKQWESRHRQK